MTAPKGIIQIVHGASEHSERYREFAGFLNSEGYLVCANDHIGHGRSAFDASELGHLPVKGGKEALIEDVHTLRKLVAAGYPEGIPYILLGHSMGGFIARLYVARYAQGSQSLAAAVISGTGQQPAGLSAFGNLFARMTAGLRGAKHKSKFLHNLGMGGLGKSIPDARTDFDWLSVDAAVVDKYIADEACGMVFTAGGYATLTELTGEMVTDACAARVPKNLPILLISGAEDPVGDQGKGPKLTTEQYRKAGLTNVTLKLYPGLRHEILNEPSRAEVYRDIVEWLERQLA
jgi:alpha-beta hydrolase superfamily lysophospholipase